MKMSELRRLRREANQKLNAENEQLLAENKVIEGRTYNQIKQGKGWHLGPILGLLTLGIGLSFLVGYLTRGSTKNPGWQGSAGFAIGYSCAELLIGLMLGFSKNRKAVRFYQDRRYRYRLTYQPYEARIRLVRRIILVSGLPFAIFTLVILFIF